MSLYGSPAWAEHPDLAAFYARHRNRPEDLYASERRFLPWLATQASTVLDAGCAVGGFKNIWRHFRSDIVYTGVDVSVSLIAAARRLHPDSQFHQQNCTAGLSLPERYASIVQALGWLHWEPQYQKVIEELWRLTDRYLFFDTRLVADPEQGVSGKQQLALMGAWDGETTTDYICVAWPAFAALVMELQPMTVLGYGYWGRPAETVMGVDREVCFATFVLEKAPRGGNPSLPTVCLDLPLPWPISMTEQVNLLPAAQLDSLVPQI